MARQMIEKPINNSKKEEWLVSIIINNYNYAEFLEEAIDSALRQTYPNIEVVVVDDGSTDGSLRILEAYRKFVILILKENGGQASAINCGFSVCKGKFVLILDADDILNATAVSVCMSAVYRAESELAKVQAPLLIRSNDSATNARRFPYQQLPSGCLRSVALSKGPASYPSPPMSGNFWSRYFLCQVLPMPETLYRKSADAYLFTLSPLFGEFATVEEPTGIYRLHSRNNYWNNNVSYEKLRYQVCQYKQRCLAMEKYASLQKEKVNAKQWRLGQRYYLAKIVSLWKMREGRSLPVSFRTFSRAVIDSDISIRKKSLWLMWFLGMVIAPKTLSARLIQAYLRLQFRVSSSPLTG
ncbi:glycosyltransferase family 2 protein [cf. Phormidesmis sp. LEGE 11477]|uniref:glycosyltransferase family 2 protein n=1 Tax=cf. Phormidesmis sp. LEGE 11477 TaxID=1828680 RepID=UPI00187F6FF8|nr:glycosyltransferase [cf. Phormidesmis sp. LEGE 11477]MBE9063607.1 glycosyltransferase [cf. Phormidesmis sp. LEGE 11477]